MTQYLSRKEAADYIRSTYAIPCVAATLAKYACGYGTTPGPAFRKVGKTVLYTKDDLDEWAKARVGPLLKSTRPGDLIT